MSVGQRSGRKKQPETESTRTPSAEPGSRPRLAASWADGTPSWSPTVAKAFLGTGLGMRKDLSEKGRAWRGDAAVRGVEVELRALAVPG